MQKEEQFFYSGVVKSTLRHSCLTFTHFSLTNIVFLDIVLPCCKIVFDAKFSYVSSRPDQRLSLPLPTLLFMLVRPIDNGSFQISSLDRRNISFSSLTINQISPGRSLEAMYMNFVSKTMFPSFRCHLFDLNHVLVCTHSAAFDTGFFDFSDRTDYHRNLLKLGSHYVLGVVCHRRSSGPCVWLMLGMLFCYGKGTLITESFYGLDRSFGSRLLVIRSCGLEVAQMTQRTLDPSAPKSTKPGGTICFSKEIFQGKLRDVERTRLP
mmetsp:Transcript_17836/g.30752  ORF Transcript_17836/g.30752 Transcript_17836/m.30752 type:complete len:265 (-) Transcript_17836:395-1189(-)